MTGHPYAHPRYALSLEEHGHPRQLHRSGSWVLERAIPASDRIDSVAPYPFLACQDWRGLADDLGELADDHVSLFAVPDPFGDHDLGLLRRCFPDRVTPFKEHFAADLRRPRESYVSPHHRRNVRRALPQVEVDVVADAPTLLDEWDALYSGLVARHGITGVATFSRASFAHQLSVPGLMSLRAATEVGTAGLALFFVSGPVAYYHLAAYSDVGYASRASYALFWQALELFADLGLHWLALGGAAGVDAREDGLARFKRGWATETRTAYACGRIFDRAAYGELSRRAGAGARGYFPAYRSPEALAANGAAVAA